MTSTMVSSTSMQSRSFVHTTDYISYTMTPVTLSPLPSKAFTPTLTGNPQQVHTRTLAIYSNLSISAAGKYPGTATWFISLIVVFVLSLIAITTYLVVDKCCTKRYLYNSHLSYHMGFVTLMIRNSLMSDLSAIWSSQHWTTQVS